MCISLRLLLLRAGYFSSCIRSFKQFCIVGKKKKKTKKSVTQRCGSGIFISDPIFSIPDPITTKQRKEKTIFVCPFWSQKFHKIVKFLKFWTGTEKNVSHWTKNLAILTQKNRRENIYNANFPIMMSFSQPDQILCMTLLSVIHMTTYIASMIGRSCVLTSQ